MIVCGEWSVENADQALEAVKRLKIHARCSHHRSIPLRGKPGLELIKRFSPALSRHAHFGPVSIHWMRIYGAERYVPCW